MGRRLQVAIDCADPVRLAAFWADVLGYIMDEPPAPYPTWEELSRQEGDDDEAWVVIADPHGVGPRVLFHRVPEQKAGKNRVHLDIQLAGGMSKADRRPLVDAESARLLRLGARLDRVMHDSADYFIVMRDPESNEFCVC